MQRKGGVPCSLQHVLVPETSMKDWQELSCIAFPKKKLACEIEAGKGAVPLPFAPATALDSFSELMPNTAGIAADNDKILIETATKAANEAAGSRTAERLEINSAAITLYNTSAHHFY